MEAVIESIVETSIVVAGNITTILLHPIIFSLFILYSKFIKIFIVIVLVKSGLKLIDNYL